MDAITFTLPEFVDEQVDCMDPLAILLVREGAGEEAYTLHRQHMAGVQQLIEGAIIQQRPDLDDEYEQRVVSRSIKRQHN